MDKVVKKRISLVTKILGVIILGFLLLLLAGFLAVRFNLTMISGAVDQNTNSYNLLENNLSENYQANLVYLPANKSQQEIDDSKIYCRLNALADFADYNAANIFKVYEQNKSYGLAEKMILAVKLRLPNKPELVDKLSKCDTEENTGVTKSLLENRLKNIKQQNVFVWQNEEPWQVVREAVIKDKDKINQASAVLDISPRLILSVAIVEQLRLYYTQRELFETVFRPLKILASANKMAWGVMSIKETAAIRAEEGMRDKNSVFYPGDKYAKLLNLTTNDPVGERYAKLTNDKDHYYSYLYGGAIIKQLIAQWQKAGYDISDRPEILATLFNIGVQNSKPKSNPQVGGSKIEIEGNKYVFGSLAYEFYYSGDLIADFPY